MCIVLQSQKMLPVLFLDDLPKKYYPGINSSARPLMIEANPKTYTKARCLLIIRNNIRVRKVAKAMSKLKSLK